MKPSLMDVLPQPLRKVGIEAPNRTTTIRFGPSNAAVRVLASGKSFPTAIAAIDAGRAGWTPGWARGPTTPRPEAKLASGSRRGQAADCLASGLHRRAARRPQFPRQGVARSARREAADPR